MPNEPKKQFFNKIPPQEFYKQTDLYRNPEINQKMEELAGVYKDRSDEPDAWGQYDEGHNGLPYVPRPSMFQADPLVIGRPDEAQLAKRLIDLDPRVKERVRSVMLGPTAGSMGYAMRNGGDPEDFGAVGIRGATDPSGEIAIDPKSFIGYGARRGDFTNLLSHELAHQAGYADEGDEAGKIGDHMQGFFKLREREPDLGPEKKNPNQFYRR